MKTRTKIAIAIILALLYFAVQNGFPRSQSEEYDVTLAELQAAYSTYNITEFNGDLPGDTLIDFNEHDKDNMATTALLTDGKFHLSFNRKYVTGVRIMNMTMLHEMCHVKTYGNEHGLIWQSCMLDLDRAGVFREILIDGYHEPEYRGRNN
jgi:hypothetical protein